jgi:hypothetical protein
MFETLSRQLVGLGALTLRHGEGTLHDHLMRVFCLLSQCGHKCAPAGAVHSIYGTNSFKHRLLEPNAHNRTRVVDMVGIYNESLAYLFSVMQRPATLEAPGVSPTGAPVLHMMFDQSMNVTPEMLRDLQLIEAANLADQNAIDKWPKLKSIWEDSK